MLSILRPCLTFAALLLYLSLSHALHIPCAIRLITGMLCPTCGTTRGVWYLLHGDVNSAIASNPISFVVVFVVIRAALLQCTTRFAWMESSLVEHVCLTVFFAAGLLSYAI